MFQRLGVLVAALALLAGCGGGSGSDATKPTTKPAPKVYTLKQLESALPKLEDIPGASKITRRCPQDKTDCEAYRKDTVATTATIEPASLVGAEQVRVRATPMDFVALHGIRQDDTAAATKAVASARKLQEPYVGTFDLPKRRVGEGVVPATHGKGSVDKLSIDAWTGIVAARTEFASDAKSDQGLLIATVHVASGRTSVTVFVSLSAAGREPGAATELADNLVRSYLQRLG